MNRGANRARASRGDLGVFLVAPDLLTRGGFELQMSLLASGLARSGAEVDVFIRQPVDHSHPYLRSMQHDSVRVHAPSPRLASLLDAPSRQGQRVLNVLLALLRPLLVLLAAGDALVRGRSYARSLVGAHGVARRLMAGPAVWDGLAWWIESRMDRVRNVRPPDIVDVQHSMIPAGIAYASARGIPVVYTEYGAPSSALESVWAGLRTVVNRADMIIGRADASIQGLRDVCGLADDRPWAIVPNAVLSGPPDGDARALDPPPDDEGVVITTIGRLSPEKGTPDVLAAFHELVMAGRPVRLVLAGDGPLRGDLERQVRTWGIGDRVTFTGAFDSLEPIMRATHIVAHPTLNDGRSVAVLEAMAWGRPVVGSAVGGVAELVEDGVTGALVPTGDVEALSAALGRLALDPEARRRMGAAGRAAFVDGDYTPAAMVSRTIEIYRSTLAQTRRQHHEGSIGT